MKGSIKWYLWCSMKVFLSVIVYIAVMALFLEADTAEYILFLTILAYAVLIFSYSYSLYKTHIPLAISMGVSRKNAFAGTGYFHLFNAVLGGGLMAVMVLISGQKGICVRLCLYMVIVIFAANALGLLCGILYRMFGWIAALLTGLVVYFVIIVFFNFRMAAGLLKVTKASLSCEAAAVALIWCVIMGVHYKTVKHLTV